jgi:ABC-type thiamin/hydroxymethylpyrimidine transport system permease subunit
MWNDTKILAANRNFVHILISFGLIYAIYGTFGFVMSNLMEPFGYTPTVIALIAMVVVLSGTVAAVLTGRFLDKTNKYHFSMKV